MVPFTIAEDVSLEIVLVGIISCFPDLSKKDIPTFNLLQNPQFFGGFPYSLRTWQRFSKIRKMSTASIEPLDPTQLLADHERELHLIVDRKLRITKEDPIVAALGPQGEEVIRNYTNIWKLDDSNHHFIVREKSGSLSLLERRENGDNLNGGTSQ
ncbi:hypothetical protein CPB83DRAFT_849463 [Crepidotus variabilis]|uniref:Uncharacterized protein n=1 Tax=Crepidotus variabilis TaxID=179855 RepID=A0A9P6EL83_9AGAR|nr:hypothetical protein CPB83DRAFT_849463 [Crepidotus variabilis]